MVNNIVVKMRAILSCPYTHPDPLVIEERIKVSELCLAWLLTQNIFAFSIIVHGHYIAQRNPNLATSWDFWANYCLSYIEQTEVLYVLMVAGWEKSTGVRGEIEHAQSLNIPVVYLQPSFIEGNYHFEIQN